MIVVVGAAGMRLPESPGEPPGLAGLGAQIATAAAAHGADVQFVGKVGDDEAGDAFVLALGQSGVGHAAIQRDAGQRTPIVRVEPEEPPDPSVDLAARSGDAPRAQESRLPLEAADLELALRYLTDFQVVVLAEELDSGATRVVTEAVSYTGGHLILALPKDAGIGTRGDSVTVLEAPESDPDGVFARLVGFYAAGLDRGLAAEQAFREGLRESGWETASSDAG